MTTALAQHPLVRRLEELHAELLPHRDGTPSQSTEALAAADPGAFGLAVATVTGQVYRAGDAQAGFSLQSAGKPFVYALALTDRGVVEVLERLGVEPTGEAFDAVAIEAVTGRPPNPMVNAGAILTASLVRGEDAAGRVERITAGLSAFAGRRLHVDEEAYAGERAAADRNLALAHLMAAEGTLPVPVAEALEVYQRLCSLEVTAVDLAVMGATLAAGGVNPLTGEQVVPVQVVTTVLTVMASCGMYDGSGQWLVRVGLPAKSGVAGGLVATKPGQLGIGSFSPPLDDHGNSVRGVLVCERLSERLGLHEFAPDGTGVEVVRALTDDEPVRSTASRPDADLRALDSHAGRIRVAELQGPFSVIAAEALCRWLLELDAPSAPSWLVLDLRDVGHIDEAALLLAQETFHDLEQSGRSVVLVDRERPAATPWAGRVPAGTPADVDDAVRSCEDALLAQLTTA